MNLYNQKLQSKNYSRCFNQKVGVQAAIEYLKVAST